MQKRQDFWHQLLGTGLRTGGGVTKKRHLLCLFKNVTQNPLPFSSLCLPSLLNKPYNLHLILFAFRQALIPTCLIHSRQYRQCLIKIVCFVSCLTRCQSERTWVLIRSLDVLRDLRILEARTGEAISQIVLWFSCSMVCVKSGSSQ